MTTRARSVVTLLLLVAILAIAAALNSFLPQGELGSMMPVSPIPKWQLALGGAGITAALYGVLGFLGLILWRSLSFPDIWDEAVTNRQRFLVPAIVGGVLGVVLIVADLIFSPINGIGRLIHPPFPTSLVASISAGIGEEMMFRLFFISFWTWLVGKLILRGRGLMIVFWVVSVLSALAFAAGHLPSLMIIYGVSNPAQFSPVLLLQIFLLSGLISIFAAYYFRKYGYLAAVGVHFWTDVIWHTVWGLF